MPYAIIAITERPIYYHEHITTPDVNVIASWRRHIRAAILAESPMPLRLSMPAAIFQRFANLEGTPGLRVERAA
jgi:hypothetical protein